MRNVIRIEEKIYTGNEELNFYIVHSEPGDCTLYSYLIVFQYPEMKFVPIKSTFPFPSKLSMYDLGFVLSETGDFERSINNLELMRKVHDNICLTCNPNTTLECLRTSFYLIKKDKLNDFFPYIEQYLKGKE